MARSRPTPGRRRTRSRLTRGHPRARERIHGSFAAALGRESTLTARPRPPSGEIMHSRLAQGRPRARERIHSLLEATLGWETHSRITRGWPRGETQSRLGDIVTYSPQMGDTITTRPRAPSGGRRNDGSTEATLGPENAFTYRPMPTSGGRTQSRLPEAAFERENAFTARPRPSSSGRTQSRLARGVLGQDNTFTACSRSSSGGRSSHSSPEVGLEWETQSPRTGDTITTRPRPPSGERHSHIRQRRSHGSFEAILMTDIYIGHFFCNHNG
jgi:hypothetical protein